MPLASCNQWQVVQSPPSMGGAVCGMKLNCQPCWGVLQQAVKLYAEEGQFNPHAARSQRKQAKKGQRRQVSLATQKAAEEEYDFAEAFDNVAVGSDEE